jgi:RimJ/RimL family protein N-acetyltransferase
MNFRQGVLVALRPLERSDVLSLKKWINDPETTQFLMQSYPMTEKNEEDWLESLSKKKDDVVLGIVTLEDERLIGTVGLHRIDHIHGTAITGTIIGEEECRSKGYGTEAKMLLLDYAFNQLNLHAIRSEVIVYNGRSLAYGKKCGYEEVGRLPEWIHRNGARHNVVMLVVTATRWRPLWEEYLKTRKSS